VAGKTPTGCAFDRDLAYETQPDAGETGSWASLAVGSLGVGSLGQAVSKFGSLAVSEFGSFGPRPFRPSAVSALGSSRSQVAPTPTFAPLVVSYS